MRLPLIVLFAWLGLVSSAAADLGLAKKHYLAGRSHYAAGDYERAVGFFELALKESPLPELYFNIAKAYDKLGKPVKAVANYRRFLQTQPDTEDRATIEDLIRRDLEQTGHIDLRVDVSGATVKVDDEDVGTSPLIAALDVDPGRHRVVIQKEGALPLSTEVAVSPGQTARFAIDANALLVPAPVAPPPATAEPEAPRTPAPPPFRSRLRMPAWILTGVAVAALGGGIGLGVASQGKSDELNRALAMMPQPAYGALADLRSTGEAFAGAGYALDVVAVAALAADAVLWTLALREERRQNGNQNGR